MRSEQEIRDCLANVSEIRDQLISRIHGYTVADINPSDLEYWDCLDTEILTLEWVLGG